MMTALLALVRTLHIGSALLLAAALFFVQAVMRPGEGDESFLRGLRRWLWAGWVLEAMSGIAWLALVTEQMCATPSWTVAGWADFATVLQETQFGQLWIGRAGLGILLAVALWFVSGVKNPRIEARWRWAALGLGVGLLISLAWAGHAGAAVDHRALHLFNDAAHLAVGVVWPGGLIPLFFFLSSQNDVRAIDVVRRFSRAALTAVLVLVATGSVNAWLLIPSWIALVTTPYGLLLAGKVAVVAIMIATGGLNRRRIRKSPNLATRQAVRQTVLLESGLAFAVLLIVGVMGQTAPPQ